MTAADGDPARIRTFGEEWAHARLPPPVTPPAPGYDYGQTVNGQTVNGPPVRLGTNPTAVAALASSIAGFVPYLGGVLSIVGIVLGTVALNQIKQAPQNGYGLAVTAIVVGAATLIIGLIWTIYAMR